MSIGSVVLMPCPASGFFAMIVTAPVVEIRMNAFGEKSVFRALSIEISASLAASSE